MTILAIGGLCLVAAALSHWLGIFIKLRSILAFIGGCTLGGGLLGRVLIDIVHFANGLLGSLAAKALGFAIPGLLVFVLAFVFLHDLHPKKGAKARTMYFGMALAVCLGAGLSAFPALNQLPANVKTGIGNVKTIGG